jgi:hypothetical protein
MPPVDPPGHRGLTGELASLRTQVREVARRSDDAVRPRCVVRLTSSVAFGSGSLNLVVCQEWQATPEADNRGMWHYNADPALCYVLLPCSGRFRITCAATWEAPGGFDAANPNIVATSILLNGTDPVTAGIAETTAYHLPAFRTRYQVSCEDRVFTSGDKIRFNFFTRYGGVSLIPQSLAAYTHFTVAYQGPS